MIDQDKNFSNFMVNEDGQYQVLTKISDTKYRLNIYQYPPPTIRDKEREKEIVKEINEEGRTEEKIDKDEKYNAYRSKKNFIDRVNANFTNKNMFLTLTFKDGVVIGRGKYKREIDIKSIEDTNEAFEQFIKRVKRKHGKDFRYIYVVEFQDKNGRGAVHYHMIWNLPFIPIDEIQNDLWKMGMCWINRMDSSKKYKDGEKKYTKDGSVDNVGAYMSKYMAKDLDDTRLEGKKAWRTSQNCIVPEKIRGAKANKEIDRLGLLKEKIPSHVRGYATEYQGNCIEFDFNFERDFN